MSKVIKGDSLEVLRTLEANSVDTIITDPPYGLSFMGIKWDYDVPSVELWKEALRVLKPGGTALIFAGSRTQHRMACNVEDAGFHIKDTIMWLYGTGYPRVQDISKNIDKKAGKKRKDLGKSPLDISNGNNGKEATVFNARKELRVTEPHTQEAKEWDGWKSHGLKPAYEPIIVAIKPNEGSYCDNALKYGVAGLNIDGCRIEGSVNIKDYGRGGGFCFRGDAKDAPEPNSKGRFPANIILDEEAGRILDEQQDGASRFFYCAKSSKAERNIGCEDMEDKLVANPGEGCAGKLQKNSGAGVPNNPVYNKNTHPTIKPIKLMEYLCTLTRTPTGGIVLDPFAGSGSTALACLRTSRDFIMIEREAEYVEIIKARIKGMKKQLKEEPNLFNTL